MTPSSHLPAAEGHLTSKPLIALRTGLRPAGSHYQDRASSQETWATNPASLRHSACFPGSAVSRCLVKKAHRRAHNTTLAVPPSCGLPSLRACMQSLVPMPASFSPVATPRELALVDHSWSYTCMMASVARGYHTFRTHNLWHLCTPLPTACTFCRSVALTCPGSCPAPDSWRTSLRLGLVPFAGL